MQTDRYISYIKHNMNDIFDVHNMCMSYINTKHHISPLHAIYLAKNSSIRNETVVIMKLINEIMYI